MITFSMQAAVSYVWNKNKSDGEFTITNLLKCAKVLICVAFKKYQVKEFEIIAMYDKYHDTVFAKEYKKQMDEWSIKVQQPSTKSNDVDDQSHETEILPSLKVKKQLVISADSFKKLLESNDYSTNFHYIVRGNVIYTDKTSLTRLPKYLTVIGNLDLSNCIYLTDLPIELRVTGDIDFFRCTSLEKLPEFLYLNQLSAKINLNECQIKRFPKNFIPPLMIV